jgi:hypothetical protein
MARLLLALMLSLAPIAASTQTATPEVPCPACLTYYHNPEGKTYLLEDVSLDRDDEARTILLNTAGHDQLHLVIFYTYSTATNVLVRLSCSADNKAFTARATESLETEGRNQRYLLSYDVAGCRSTRVLVSGSADANSADVVTLQAVGQTIEENLPVQ